VEKVLLAGTTTVNDADAAGFFFGIPRDNVSRERKDWTHPFGQKRQVPFQQHHLFFGVSVCRASNFRDSPKSNDAYHHHTDTLFQNASKKLKEAPQSYDSGIFLKPAEKGRELRMVLWIRHLCSARR
jgi:hypothetical protein